MFNKEQNLDIQAFYEWKLENALHCGHGYFDRVKVYIDYDLEVVFISAVDPAYSLPLIFAYGDFEHIAAITISHIDFKAKGTILNQNVFEKIKQTGIFQDPNGDLRSELSTDCLTHNDFRTFCRDYFNGLD